MAALVTTKTLKTINENEVVVYRTNRYVDAAETAAIAIDKSTLLLKGAEPSALCLMYLKLIVLGYTSVTLAWDHTTDVEIGVFTPGTYEIDLREFGGAIDAGSGQTGDLIVTTAGTTASNSYFLTVVVRMEE